ncbi:carbamate kinase [Candidatus Micrarchaeota archaeon]|nr:carbamate kinase [Candidatus Micrarchaeota archaeon]
MKTAVVALGGNAFQPAGEKWSYKQLARNVDKTCEILKILTKKYRLVISHGNAPQVGLLMLQQESTALAPKMPLDVLDAMTQGQLGYLIQKALNEKLKAKAVTVITQVLVDSHDPAFRHPTKPIGPYYKKKIEEDMVKQPGGWRRVVASPKPLRIIEIDEIKSLVKSGYVVISCGGGGIPVVKDKGKLIGVEAVIDKDLAAAVLAEDVKADMLIILTDVKAVFLNYRGGKGCEMELRKTTPEDAQRYMKEGHFAPGSMGPKVQAAIDFALKGGKTIITSPRYMEEALKGDAGTLIE